MLEAPIRDSFRLAEELEYQLRALPRHGLDTAGALPLLRRFDTKFLLPESAVPDFLGLIGDGYSVLALDDNPAPAYGNLYLDSPDLRLYHLHHNQRLQRLKARIRTYRHTGRRFFELKVKNGAGRTGKLRAPLEAGGEGWEGLARRLNPGFPAAVFEGLRETVDIGYRRISLQHGTRRERLSIDLDIGARATTGGRGFKLRGLAVIELKQEALDRSSAAFAALRALGCRPSLFSKYCVSCTLLFPERLKLNRFKKLLYTLQPRVDFHEGGTSDGFASA